MRFYDLPPTLSAELDAIEKLVADRLAGKISEDELRPRRIPFGVYEERGGGTYMVRVRTPGGAVTPEQLMKVAEVSAECGDEFFHVTTRQELQIHSVKLEKMIPAIRRLMPYGLATRGGGGNTVRNIVGSPGSGVDPDEVFDIGPHVSAVTSRLLAEPDSWNLPRKFKLAFSNSDSDTARARFADLGFIARIENGERGFAVYVAGGMGAKSSIAMKMHSFLPERQLYLIVTAVKRLFNEHGQRRNKHRARLRFLREDLGDAEFLKLYERTLSEVQKAGVGELDVKQFTFENAATPSREALATSSTLSGFEGWKRRFVSPQKQAGLFQVLIPFRLGKIPNEIGLRLATFLRGYGENVIRLTPEQNVLLRNIPETRLPDVFEAAVAASDYSTHPRAIADMISCAGADTCKLGICLSRGAALDIEKTLVASALDLDALQGFAINLSGCPNSCGRHPFADLGFFGRTHHRNGRYFPAYAVLVGGRSSGANCRMGAHVGDIPAREIGAFTRDLLSRVIEEKNADESFPEYFDRAGRRAAEELIAMHAIATVPDFETAPEYYHDFGVAEPFSLAARGMGECSAGIFDLIELDRKNVKLALESLGKTSEGAESAKLLHDIVHYASRMLLVTRGVDAGTRAEVFAQFRSRFIDAGLVAKRFGRIIELAESGNLPALMESRNDVIALCGDVQRLYDSMDNHFKFASERESASTAPPAIPVVAPIAESKAQTEIRTFDFRGVACPMNFVKVKMELSKIASGSRIRVLLDDGAPIANVPRSVEAEGHKVLSTEKIEKHWAMEVEKS